MPRGTPSLTRLRELRVPRDRDHALASDVERLRAELARRQKRGGSAGAAWEIVVPDALRERAEVIALTRGVLSVRVRDSAARYALDRFLRSGGEATLIRTAKVAIKRVRLVT